jgi:hypothetical protein
VSGRVVHLGSDVHGEVQALLPWYVCASLDAEERARVEDHLVRCPRCRAQLAWERTLQSADAGVDAPRDVEADLARVRERMADMAAPLHRAGLRARLQRGWKAWASGPAWMRWAMEAQCAAVVALSVLLLTPSSVGERYRALGGPAVTPGAGNLIVRFRPEATEQEMRRALRDSDARLVHGPTTTGAYLLSVPPGHEEAAVVRLRKDSSVVLVESLDGRGGT